MRACIPALLLLALCAPVQALERGAAQAQASRVDRTTARLSAQEQALAAQWDLTGSEWRRYRTLMQGIRGSLSVAGITPLEVLGIHAESNAERTRYAELFAQLMEADTARVLAFQRAYQDAWQRLYPDIPVVDPALSGTQDAFAMGAIPALKGGDRLLYFAKPKCPKCDAALKPLLTRVGEARGWGMDIYLLGSKGDDGAVRRWAQARGIDPALVTAGSITLNHDRGTLARLAGEGARLPQLLHQRGQDFTILEFGQ